MKKIIFAIVCTILMSACTNENELLIDPGAAAPVISDIAVPANTIRYGEKTEISFSVSDNNVVSHVTVQLIVNNANVFEKTIPVIKSSAEIKDTLFIPFGAYAQNQQAEIKVSAMNKSMKTAEKTQEVALLRPVFEKIYLVLKDQTTYEMTKTEGSYEYKANVDLPNQTQAYLYSGPNQTGYKWGWDATANKATLLSETLIEFEDSENTAGKITEISFNAMTFNVAPLKKVMTVNGVEFLPISGTPELKKATVSLTAGSEVLLELMDPTAILFDPDFFEVTDGKLFYKGITGSCSLYYNSKFQFVFVENTQNKITAQSGHLINGWGFGWPEIWNYNPSWDFNKANSMRQEQENVYVATTIVVNDANLKFYTGADWGHEIAPTSITYTTNILEAKEESGKPGNYNIVIRQANFNAKYAIVKMTLTNSGGHYSLNAKILRSTND